MRIKIALIWDSVRSSYWFVPCLMVVGAMLLAVLTGAADRTLSVASDDRDWLFSGGPEGARTLLSMLAASMITIFGVVFSIVIVALTLASSQYGPRLLRSFLRDIVDQVAVGTFISTFVYCVLVLRTVRESEPAHVPSFSVATAVLLTLISLGVLIFFINHLSASLQASHIIAAVGADLMATIQREFDQPREASTEVPATASSSDWSTVEHAIPASRDGYVQAIEYEILLQLAEQRDLRLAVPVLPGDFVVRGDTLALSSRQPDDEATRLVNGSFLLGTERTVEQDVEFPINQLVQLAARSLSPAINDPITAMMAIEQLRAGLCRIAECVPLPVVIPGTQGIDRLQVARHTPGHITDAAFSLLRQYGRENLEVSLCLLNAIEQVACRTEEAEFRGALLRQATLIEAGAQSGLVTAWDRHQVAERCLAVMETLGAESESGAQGQADSSPTP